MGLRGVWLEEAKGVATRMMVEGLRIHQHEARAANSSSLPEHMSYSLNS